MIAFFNHKGGVGKTTTVYNLAASLSDKGQKVLLIDADPQMNLTASIYGLSLGVKYSAKIKNITEDQYMQEEAKSIRSEEEKWKDYQSKYLRLDVFLDNFLNSDSKIHKEAPKPYFRRKSKISNGYIDLISGSIRTIEIESALYRAVTIRDKSDRGLLVRFQDAIDFIKKEKYDFILIDSSPNATSVMTALLVLLSDYWVAPVIPSFYSLQAIDNLADIMKSWIFRGDNNIEANQIDGLGLGGFMPTKNERGIKITAKFLGLIIQQSKRYKVDSGCSKGWMQDLNLRLQSYIDWESNNSKRFISQKDFTEVFKTSNPYIIYSCYDFTQVLRSISDRAGVPIVHLTDDICSKNKLFRGFEGKNRWKAISIKPVPDGTLTKKGKLKEQNQYYIAFSKTQEAYNQIADDLINNLHKI